VRAEHLPQALVTSFADQVQVEFAECGQEAVAVGADDRLAAGIGRHDAIVHDLRVRQHRGEYAVIQGLQRVIDAADPHRHGLRVRAQHPHRRALGMGVRAEHGVRVGMGARREQHEIAPFHRKVLR
jgi:hypothetical protein